MWTDKLKNVYNNDFEHFLGYCDIFKISERLGFKTPQEAWEANPTIQGSTNPNDLKVVNRKKKLKLPSGTTGFYNRENKWQATGSQMGRRDTLPENLDIPIKLQLVRLKWVDGDYDEGGAYWGNTGKDSIFCAFGEHEEEEFTVYMYIRAVSREQAKEKIRETLKNSKFYR